MPDEVLALAGENQRKASIANVEFLKGEIEHMPLADNSATTRERQQPSAGREGSADLPFISMGHPSMAAGHSRAVQDLADAAL